jgi:hypothetical protein
MRVVLLPISSAGGVEIAFLALMTDFFLKTAANIVQMAL